MKIVENQGVLDLLIRREMKAEAEITGMFPTKESAKMAETTGNMLRHPLTMFEI